MNCKKLDNAHFETRRRGFSKKNRPRRETILDVMRILKEEFEGQISSTINMPLYNKFSR
jgi:hypothetical protein